MNEAAFLSSFEKIIKPPEYHDGTICVEEAQFGKGVFAERPIHNQEVIFEFPFEDRDILTFDEAVALGDTHVYPLQIDKYLYLELQSPHMYLNHSCDPNTGIQEKDGKFFLVAIKDIPPTEEITFDYSTDTDEEFFSMECQCKAPDCRGTISDFKNLPANLQQKYLQLNIVPNFIAKQYTS